MLLQEGILSALPLTLPFLSHPQASRLRPFRGLRERQAVRELAQKNENSS